MSITCPCPPSFPFPPLLSSPLLPLRPINSITAPTASNQQARDDNNDQPNQAATPLAEPLLREAGLRERRGHSLDLLGARPAGGHEFQGLRQCVAVRGQRLLHQLAVGLQLFEVDGEGVDGAEVDEGVVRAGRDVELVLLRAGGSRRRRRAAAAAAAADELRYHGHFERVGEPGRRPFEGHRHGQEAAAEGCWGVGLWHCVAGSVAWVRRYGLLAMRVQAAELRWHILDRCVGLGEKYPVFRGAAAGTGFEGREVDLQIHDTYRRERCTYTHNLNP